MDRYTWTAEHRALATFGSSLVIPTHGGDRRIDVLWPAQNNYLRFKEDGTSLPLFVIDPATIQPPSLGFIQQLARDRLGESAEVKQINEYMAPYLDLGFGGYCSDGFVYRFEFSDHARLDRFRAAVSAIVALSQSRLEAMRG